jgi:hypothetical protein
LCMRTCGEQMEALVCLETIASVPVTTAFHKRAATFDILLDQNLVAEEETNAYYGEDDVDACSQNPSLFVGLFEG